MRIQNIFRAGEDGNASYRIPTLIALPGGRVIAFCEARRDSVSDTGCIRIVARVSADGGANFGPMRTVAEDGVNTVGNPSPLYDRETGRLWLLLNGNLSKHGEGEILAGRAPRTVLACHSDDLGETWTPLVDLSAQLKRDGWTWYAIGPCHGAQLASGRLLFPCNHAVLDPARGQSGPYCSHTVYSDDHGASWRLGADVGANTNECTLAELPDGRVYLNMRSYRGEHCRAAAYSADGGASFGPVFAETQLPEPICQASVLSCDLLDGKSVLFFSNPAHPARRECLTLRASEDGAQTWRTVKVIWAGPAAYSDLTRLPDGGVACLFECGESGCVERIDMAYLDAGELSAQM